MNNSIIEYFCIFLIQELEDKFLNCTFINATKFQQIYINIKKFTFFLHSKIR